MLFGLFAFGDVPDGCRYQDPLGAFERTQHDLDGKLASILSPTDELNPRSHLLRQRLGRGSGTVSDQPLCEAFRDDVLHLLSYKFITVVTELFLRLKVQKNDFSTLVHDNHRIWGCLQQPSVLRSRLLPLAKIAADL